MSRCRSRVRKWWKRRARLDSPISSRLLLVWLLGWCVNTTRGLESKKEKENGLPQ